MIKSCSISCMLDLFHYFYIQHGTISRGGIEFYCGQKIKEVRHKTLSLSRSLSCSIHLPPSLTLSLILTDDVRSRNVHANGPSAYYVQGKSQTISPHLTQSSTFLPGTCCKLLTAKPLQRNTQYQPPREIGDTVRLKTISSPA